MQEILTIRDLMTASLPEIQQALGQARWPAFASQLRSHAAAFENLADEAELTDAVNRLMGLFVAEAVLFEIIIRFDSTTPSDDERQHPSNSQPPPVIVPLDTATLANSFFLLCKHPDLIAAGATLDEIAARSDTQQHKLPRAVGQ